MNTAFAPPNRSQNLSPASTIGSEWSGVNNYSHSNPRLHDPYNTFTRNDSFPQGSNGPPPSYLPNGGGPSPGDGMQQRRPSQAESRGSSGAASLANSRASDGTLSDVQSRKYRKMEMELSQHYVVLKSFLKGAASHPPRPNKARDKLLRLSPLQFHELSTDVFDELQRRQAAAPLPGRPPRPQNVPPFLQPRSDFHEKRNQARQKLSTLQHIRFRDLSTDVFCELERRFPHFGRPDADKRDSSRSQSRGPGGRPPMANGLPSGPNGFVPPPRSHSHGQSVSSTGFAGRESNLSLENGTNGAEYGRPMPRQFQSNTITPNKSMMVEDEDEVQGVTPRYDDSSDAYGLESSLTSPRSDRETSATSQSIASLSGKVGPLRITELQEKVTELEQNLETKEHELRTLRENSKSHTEFTSLKQDLERKLDDAQQLNQSLKDQLERFQADQAAMERDLRSQLDNAKSGAGHESAWESKYTTLEQEHHNLQDELKHQREITGEVSRQGQMYLEEMRAMAESGGGNLEREEKLSTENHKLEEEVREWKARYVKTKAQLRSVRASSLGLSIARQDVGRYANDKSFHQQDGLVKDVHVTKFQIAIDELLRIARSGEPAAVLDHMKTVVLAVRAITTDIDAVGSEDKDEEMVKRRAKLKTRVSATANNVITASKNYAAAGGLSPVSLLDAAASHLTAAVVDLVRTVKIKPTPAGELDDDDDGALEPLQSNGYFNITESLRRKSATDSVYSALSTPVADRSGNVRQSHGRHSRNTSNYGNGAGLGIQAALGMRPEESELEELKVCFSTKVVIFY